VVTTRGAVTRKNPLPLPPGCGYLLRTVIRVTGLTKAFGPTIALSDVSFELKAGEAVGLLGRNGAGKTTTMRILTGYFPPTDGRAEVCGHDVFEEPIAVKQRVGYLPESPPVYPDMSVASYLRFCGRLRRMTEAEIDRRLVPVLGRCGLDAVAHRLIGHLSRGYRQRVGLAQALVHDPDVLILDEPTAALDPGQIAEIRGLIRELVAEVRPGAANPRRTIILSTHRLEDVAATCGRALIVSRGRLVADEVLGDATAAADLERRFLEVTRGEESR
jgi:ABC-2 type transport system ATP-binding protein